MITTSVEYAVGSSEPWGEHTPSHSGRTCHWCSVLFAGASVRFTAYRDLTRSISQVFQTTLKFYAYSTNILGSKYIVHS